MKNLRKKKLKQTRNLDLDSGKKDSATLKFDLEQFSNLCSGKQSLFIPNEITLFGEKFKVTFKDEIKVKDGKKASGTFSYGNREIQLKKNNRDLPNTYFHELCHLRSKIFSYEHNPNLHNEINGESLVSLEGLFWSQIFLQSFPIGKLYELIKKQTDEQPNPKDVLIKKLERKIKRLENKLSIYKFNETRKRGRKNE